MIGLQGRKITSAAFFHDDPVNILSAASAFFVVISIAAPSLFKSTDIDTVRIPQKNSVFNTNKL